MTPNCARRMLADVPAYPTVRQLTAHPTDPKYQDACVGVTMNSYGLLTARALPRSYRTAQVYATAQVCWTAVEGCAVPWISAVTFPKKVVPIDWASGTAPLRFNRFNFGSIVYDIDLDDMVRLVSMARSWPGRDAGEALERRPLQITPTDIRITAERILALHEGLIDRPVSGDENQWF